jgi:hypothetical protein
VLAAMQTALWSNGHSDNVVPDMWRTLDRSLAAARELDFWGFGMRKAESPPAVVR